MPRVPSLTTDPKPVIIERIIEKIVHVHMADDSAPRAVATAPSRRELVLPPVGDVSVEC